MVSHKKLIQHYRRQFFKEKAKRENRCKRDRLAHSMLYAERTHADGEYWTDYGFILPEEIVYDYDPEETEWDAYLDLTDDEINEWVEEHMCVRICSDYDCTGRPFTRFINWHRNPCGLISYEHHMALDI